jgi:hypothetical protein
MDKIKFTLGKFSFPDFFATNCTTALRITCKRNKKMKLPFCSLNFFYIDYFSFPRHWCIRSVFTTFLPKCFSTVLFFIHLIFICLLRLVFLLIYSNFTSSVITIMIVLTSTVKSNLLFILYPKLF